VFFHFSEAIYPQICYKRNKNDHKIGSWLLMQLKAATSLSSLVGGKGRFLFYRNRIASNGHSLFSG